MRDDVITNVAAGTVQLGSTDAVNAGQLYGVIEVFGKLKLLILGSEKLKLIRVSTDLRLQRLKK